jgi:hypothetical protein
MLSKTAASYHCQWQKGGIIIKTRNGCDIQNHLGGEIPMATQASLLQNATLVRQAHHERKFQVKPRRIPFTLSLPKGL